MENEKMKKIKIEEKKVWYSKKGLMGYINIDVSRYIDNSKNLLKNLDKFVQIKNDTLSVSLDVIEKLEALKKRTKDEEKKAISNLLTSLKNVTGINKPIETVHKNFNNSYQL